MNASQTEVVLRVLHDHLGKSTSHKHGERSFQCPFCSHHKKKLQINVVTQKWHCWVCNAKGQTISSLLYKSQAPKYAFDRIKEVYGNIRVTTSTKSTDTFVTLPKEYKPLYQQRNTPHYKNAIHYAIHKRNLTPYDIVKYEIGYCETGPYGGMLIVPSYSSDGLLNYFVGRSFYDTPMKHKNPAVSKDVIGFDSHINWTEPIIIVEGAYDAITTKRNVIPLFGKKILPTLRSRILQENPPALYLALDSDAYVDSYNEIEYFVNNGMNVYYVNLNDKDPNELGHEGMLNAIQEADQISFFDLIKYKMNL